MEGLTWLHLSDWHEKGKDFNRQVVRDTLLNDIENRVAISPDLAKIDFIVFSGDVAYSGKPEEYQAAKKELLDPLFEATNLSPDRLFIVPGNHDLDRTKFDLLPAALTQPLISDDEIQKWLNDDLKRGRLLEPFQAFTRFVTDYTGQEKPDYGNIRRMQISGKSIALLGINSAWMCGRYKDAKGNVDDRGYVLVGEHQIHRLLGMISDAEIKIAVLHHPFDWLAEFDRSRVEPHLVNKCDLILHGQQNDSRINVMRGTSGNCVIIPVGACYDRRLTENTLYTNSYNLVHLDFDTGKGIVFLRRWSDRRNQWINDSDSYQGGKFEFNLPAAMFNNSLSHIESQERAPVAEKETKPDEEKKIHVPVPKSSIISILRRLDPEALNRNAICDLPVRLLKDDKLGFNIYVRALKDFIASQDTATPLTIGIDSHWGTGKTSLMQMLKNELDPDQTLLSKLHWSLTWLWWLTLYIITFPLWLIGSVAVLLGNNANTKKESKLNEVKKGLNFDPSAVSETVIETWSTWSKFWAWIGKRHSPITSSYLPTIWFNAWKFDQEETLWAAMALTVIENLKRRYGPVQRATFWFRLTWKRFSTGRALWKVFVDILIPIILLLAALSVDNSASILKASNDNVVLANVLSQINNLISIMPIPSAVSQNPWILKLVFFIGSLVWGFKQYSGILKNPFQISTKNLFDQPEYEKKIGFVGSFQKDFEAIVSVATKPIMGWKPTKLVIFIDDLDRCTPPKAADIIQAINQFLDCPGCVFVIGMDSTAVVTSIEIKYKELFEKIKQENVGVVSPGRLFLDKIVQINFHIPMVTEESMKELAINITKPKTKGIDASWMERSKNRLAEPQQSHAQPSPASQTQLSGKNLKEKDPLEATIGMSVQIVDKALQSGLAGRTDIASYGFNDVRSSIFKGSGFLQNNPRQLKRFINQFRLMVYISHEKELFNERKVAEVDEGLTLDMLAIWVAWSIRWPELAKELFDGGWRLEIRDYLHKVATMLKNDGSWNDLEDLSKESIELMTKRSNIDKSYSTSHWLLLPWEHWLTKNDFRECIKHLDCFWKPPEDGTPNEKGQQDMLEVMLTMTSSFGTPATIRSPESIVDNSI